LSLVELSGRRPRLVLLVLAAAVAFSFQGSRGLFETTEGRYAESALEMVQRGDYLEPTLAGRPHWTKPPMAYWAIAAGIHVAGVNGWGARLANAVAFCATVLLVAGIGAALWDRETGFVAGLVYLSSLFPAAGAAALSADTLVALFEVLAVYLWVRAWREEAPARSRRFVRAMWIAWGLAFMTKGPAALLPLLALVAVGRLSRRRVALADPLGLAAFAAVAFSWFAWVTARHPGLLSYYVGDEVVGRAVSNEFKRNPQWWKPFVLYLPVLVLGQGLWLAFGARIPRAAGLASPRALWARVRRGDAGSLLLLWLVLPLAVFWLSSSRLPLYVLPLYAPIALAIARTLALARAGDGSAVRRALSIAVPSALVIVALKGAAAFALPPSPSDMGRLYAIARREAGPGALVRAYGPDPLYGLQFYLGGALRRVSRAGGEPWADEGLEAAVAALRRSASGAPQVLVSRAGAAGELEGALTAAGLPHRRVRAPSRELFIVSPPASARADPESPP
jgi:4-amino-4-deoxy-L-arabinose transferase-like glycosyltransferase